MAAAAARTLLRNGKSHLPLFLRGQILGRSTIDVNLNTIPIDHQFLQSLLVSNQNLQTLKPIFDSSDVGKGQEPAAQAESRNLALGDPQGSGLVVQARGRRAVSDEDDSDDSDGDIIDDDLDEGLDDISEDFDDFDEDDDDDKEEDNYVRKIKK